jgi:UDP-2,4-diacetamido-2,4,6-trideoxy-beta-L-altropyranose hydrolase
MKVAGMNVAFRVDASSLIGTGHFVRCLTLASELKRRGANTLIVSRDLPAHLREMLLAGQHGFAALAQAPLLDADETLEALSGSRWDWLVVDHYGLDAAWETRARRGAARVAVIDDIANRRHDCDLLLDQNLQAEGAARYAGKVPPSCVLLLGPRFVLLREEFRILHERVQPREAAVTRILIFFGGMDAANHTARAVDAVAALGLRGVHVDVVAGRRHPRVDELRDECARAGFSYHVQTERMAELIAAADLAIGAGGTAVWERCCLGLPQLAIRTAENQREQLAAAAAAGLAYVPDPADDVAALIRRHVGALLENQALRHLMARIGMRTVDGRGASRVAAAMGSSGIEVRVATAADSRKLHEWRNDPAVRAVSRTTAPIDWDTHQRWLESVLKAPDRSLLIGERQDTPVGVVRFDMRDSEAQISIYLVPGDHPPGEGRSLLESAERWLAARRPDVTRFGAEVIAGNARSEGLFLGSGYRLDSTRYVKRIDGR